MIASDCEVPTLFARVITMIDQAALVARLAQHRTLREAPHAELEWLGRHGEMLHFERGDLLGPNQPSVLESLGVVLSGRFAIYVDHGAGPHKVLEWSAGDVTGLLPYSRMSKPIGTMIVDEPIDVLAVHRSHFPEMIRECPTITTTLVHVMIDRARQFRSSELQDEKMRSLGKLSAGLAHELNNPASAAARSAKTAGRRSGRRRGGGAGSRRRPAHRGAAGRGGSSA